MKRYINILSILLSILVLANIIVLTISAGMTISAQREPPYGPWVDKVVFIEESDTSKAVEMLIASDIHVYFDDITDSELFKKIRNSLAYDFSYGLYYELTFNPVGPEFPNPQAGVIFNPFSNQRIREAINYIIDREYIANEILGGLAIPRYTVLTPSFPDYARYADTILDIENEYRYDFKKGKEIIYGEMIKMGAEFRDGKWYYKNQPVKLIFLIRIEDARKKIGEYISSQLENLGFEVEKIYGKSIDLAPKWLRGDPSKGEWHLYTGAWITEIILRDESGNFGFYYTKLGQEVPLWQSYVNTPEFYEIALKLWNRDYKSIDERDELMRKALWLSMKESQRIWLVHLTAVWARRPEILLASDLAGGYAGSALWPYTIRFADKIGGTIKIGLSSILVQPWNPIGGSNWLMDQAIIRATGEPAVLPDPYTGLYHALRIKKAEIYISKELEGQIKTTLPWIELHFVDEIVVPPDAWWRFNSSTNIIESVPPDTKAKVKVVIYYQDDLLNKYKWHDGSRFSLADMVYSFLLRFDRINQNSPLYDDSAIPSFEAWFATFKGLRIVNENPIVLEYYTDTWYMDAEWIANMAANDIWPYYSYGPGAWHVLSLVARAEVEGRTAFTADKSERMKVEWVNLIAGPTLSTLAEVLDKCINEAYIPYEPVLGKYVSREEASQRYQNLKSWYQAKKHFWIGNGPFYLDGVDTIAKIITISAYREYIDKADRWLIFAKPPVPEVKIFKPDIIYPGEEAKINISILIDDKPYKLEHIDFVKYVIKHAYGTLSGYAECVDDGKCVITLNKSQTVLLPTGPASIKIIAVSKLVGKPGMASDVIKIASIADYITLKFTQIEAEISARLSSLREELEKLDLLEKELENIKGMLYVSIGMAIIAILIPIAITISRKIKI